MRHSIIARLTLLVLSISYVPYGWADVGTPPDVLIISIDTLRADRLGAYGYQRNTSPQIDAFAKKSVVFEGAIAESPWTLPSHVSMLSGLLPSSHGVTLQKSRIARETELLAERLKSNGYNTYGYTDGAFLRGGYGFSRGFDRYESEHRGFEDRIGRVINQMQQQSAAAPAFYFLHTYDVHCPFNPPEPFFGSFHSDNSESTPVKKQCGTHFNKKNLSPAQARYVSDRYDDGIRWADANLKKLFEFLTENGRWNKTVVIITSDHGEEFAEHGRFGHKKTLYKEVLHIPLIIRVPGVAPRRVSSLTGLIDIVPTVLELIGLTAPGGLDGVSLSCQIKGIPCKVAALTYRLSELDRHVKMRSVINADYHYISSEDSKQLLFSRRDDPEQRNNLSEEKPAISRRMAGRIRENSRLESGELVKDAVPADLARELLSLGYAQ